MAGFIFGGNTGETPESLKRKREIANALAMSAVGHAPRNIGEGLSSIGQALAYRAIAGKADKAAAAGQESANAAFNPIVAALGGGGAFPAAPGGSPSADTGTVTSAPLSPVTDAPTKRVDQAFAASAPDTGTGGTDWLQYANKDAIRNQPLDPKLTSALGFLPDMGVTMKVFSGGQEAEGPRRTGSHRHDHGDAADVFFYKDGKQLDWANPQDVPVFQQIVERAKANGVTGFGAGEGYMRPGSMHIGFGTPAVWGAGGRGTNAPDWLRQAFSENVPANSSVAMSGPPTSTPAQAPNGASGQLPDAEALKLLGASPVTRDAQGGPSIAMLLRSAANPWLNKNQSAVVSALLQEKLKQQDPTTQLDMRYKQAQLNALENPTKAPTVQQFYDPQTGQPYEAQWNPKTKAWDKVGGNKASSNGITVSPDGTVQIGGPTKPLTEAQSKDAVFFTRGAGALPTLDQFGNALTSLPEAVGGNAPVVGNYLKSKEYQQASQAGKEFLQAILRKDTGAAITKEETAEYGSVYLPQPGDGPEVLAQKKAARHRALAAIKIGLPPMAILGMEKAGVDLGQGELPKAPKKPVVIDGYTIEQVE